MQLKPQFSYFFYLYIISIYVCISIYIYCTSSPCRIIFLWTIRYSRKQNHKVLTQGNSVRLTQEESKRSSKYISSLSNDVVGYQETEAKYLSLWRSYNNGLCLGLRAKQIPSPTPRAALWSGCSDCHRNQTGTAAAFLSPWCYSSSAFPMSVLNIVSIHYKVNHRDCSISTWILWNVPLKQDTSQTSR